MGSDQERAANAKEAGAALATVFVEFHQSIGGGILRCITLIARRFPGFVAGCEKNEFGEASDLDLVSSRVHICSHQALVRSWPRTS